MYTVQIIDKNGQFLSHLLIRPSGIFFPQSLAYDINTHRLWVGSKENNTVCVYMYIARQTGFTCKSIWVTTIHSDIHYENDHLFRFLTIFYYTGDWYFQICVKDFFYCIYVRQLYFAKKKNYPWFTATYFSTKVLIIWKII